MLTSCGTDRRRWLRGLAALPVASVTGCVVAPYGTYHRPSIAHAGARARKAWCQGTTGPETGIELELNGLRLSARTESRHASSSPGLQLLVDMVVPPGIPLQWTGAPRLEAAGRPLAVEPAVSASRAFTLAADAWLDTAAMRPGTTAVEPDAPHGVLTGRVEPVHGLSGQVVVEGLALERSGERAMLPAAVLARPASKALPHLYRSEAEQAALRAREAACRRDTPQSACANIVEFGGVSHSAQDPVARWSGRWYQTTPRGGPRFEGEVSVRPLVAGRWRLATDAFRVRDVASGTSHALRLSGLHVAFRDELAPQALVPPSGVETHVLVQATLAPDTQTFQLLLPPVVVQGTRVEPPPIVFERRSFDGGVHPLNC